MATVRFDRATRLYPGAELPSVNELTIDIADGEFLVLVGPSGCGKSTSLHMLAGLEEVNSGRIWIGERDVTHVPPRDRDVAIVFQNYALYPHMTVEDNMGFALRIAGVDRGEVTRRVAEAARILELEGMLHSRPDALSGGQRQRVAMGRAIVREPRVFLMDEPLSNLDPTLRETTRSQIAYLQHRLGITTVYATQHQLEAMTTGDRVAVLREGSLLQCDTPGRLIDAPADVFVATFIGSPSMNLYDAPIREAAVWFGGHRVPLPVPSANMPATLVLGVRPEDLDLRPPGEAGLAASVTGVQTHGGDRYVVTQPTDDAGATVVLAAVPEGTSPTPGEPVTLVPRGGHVHLFHPDTGLRLGG